MSHSLVVKSFAELADAFNLDGLVPDETPGTAELPSALDEPGTVEPDLSALLARIEAAGQTLTAIIRQDQENRALALRDLAQYDALVARQREAASVVQRAQQIRRDADALNGGAFAEAARVEAIRVAEVAARAEAEAARLVEQWQREAEHLAAQLDLERLLAERRRQEEAEKAKAAAAARAERLSGALVRARSALEGGRFEEAQGLLGQVRSEDPDNPEIASLMAIITQREVAVKVSATEEALWEARRLHRRDPAAAIARLEALEVGGLPEPLARQVFGEWARACARLCRDREIVEPLRYAPDPGRGAVIAREAPDGAYVVVSAIGMGPSWLAGSAVGEHAVRRARPLR